MTEKNTRGAAVVPFKRELSASNLLGALAGKPSAQAGGSSSGGGKNGSGADKPPAKTGGSSSDGGKNGSGAEKKN